MYVYKITNNINSKIYIGITNNYQTRWRLHKQTAMNPKHKDYDKVLYKAFRKHGIDNFSFAVLCHSLTTEEAKLKEIELIKDFNCRAYEHGYNVSPGGDLPICNPLQGEDCPNSMLTNQQVQDIICMRESGMYQKSAVFAKYKAFIGLAGFNDIWSGRRWKQLQPTDITKVNANIGTTKAQAIEIIQRREAGELQRDVFKDYTNMITKTAFQYVWLGYVWKSLQPKSIKHKRGKLTDVQIQEIRCSTDTYRNIAKQYSISSASVSDIKNYKIYTNVPDKV